MAQTFFGSDYDSVQVGGSKPLPKGGYICRIIKARMTKSANNLPMLEALFDICEGEYSNYFGDKYRNNLQRNPQSEYPSNGRAKVVAVDENGKTKRTFKGFVTSVEHSNEINLPREDNAFLKALEGKTIGVIFGREEFEGTDGKTHWATKPRWYRSVQDIESGNYDVPEDTYLPPSAPSAFAQGASDLFGGMPVTETSGVDSFSAAMDDIPF